jgi:predicted metal-dependent enzyme (double-stranded beta helix superfamily)
MHLKAFTKGSLRTNRHCSTDGARNYVYGANIGAVQRSASSAEGVRKQFISGYSNDTLPNLWDLSRTRNKNLIAAD